MKITLAERKAFNAAWSVADPEINWCYNNQWEPDIDDKDEVIPNFDLKTEFKLHGFISWQGEGKPKPNGFLGEHSLSTAVEIWRKLSKSEVRVIEIPKDRFSEVQDALAKFGITIKPAES